MSGQQALRTGFVLLIFIAALIVLSSIGIGLKEPLALKNSSEPEVAGK